MSCDQDLNDSVSRINCYNFLLFFLRVFMGITNEQEHRGVTVQQGGVKVREGRGGCF